MSSPVDHLIFATPDLQGSIEYLETLLGVPAIAGGSHPGLGTCNWLLALGPQCYLEIMAPDPEQTEFQGSRPFGIDTLESGQLVGWVARRENLSQFIKTVQAKNIELGAVISVSREAPGGELLEWEMTYLMHTNADVFGVMPLFIDWGKTPHPANRCAGGAQLTALEIEYPQPPEIEPYVDALELDVLVRNASRPGIRALIDCPRGAIELSTPR